MSPVNVEPQTTFAAQFPDLANGIVEPGCGGTGVDPDGHHPPAFIRDPIQTRSQFIGERSPEIVDRRRHQRRCPETHGCHRAGERIVGTGGGDHHEIGWRTAHPRLGGRRRAGGKHGGEIGEGSTVGQSASTRKGARCRRIVTVSPGRLPTDLGEHPVDDRDLHRPGGGPHFIDRHPVGDGA